MKRKITALFIVVMMLICAANVSADSEYTIDIIKKSVSADKAEIWGSISVAKKTALEIKVEKDGAVWYENDIMTDEKGEFKTEFPVEASEDNTQTYNYVISEKMPEGTVENLLDDDFSAKKSYIVYGEADSSVGNGAPSVKVKGQTRLLYRNSGPETESMLSGIFTVEADIMLPEVSGRRIFGTTNHDGNANYINTEINKVNIPGGVYEAYKVSSEGNELVIEYTDNAVNQTALKKSTICSYETGKWYNIKIVMDIDTLELKVYLNGTRILEDTDMYIFAQRNYNRLFDTWRADNYGTLYIDNLKIDKTTKGKKLGLADAEGSIVCYGSVEYAKAVKAVNEADVRSMEQALTDYADIIGIDIAALQRLSENSRQMVFENIAVKQYASVQEIRNAFKNITVFAEITETPENLLAEKIKLNEAILGFKGDSAFYGDSDIIHCIFVNMPSARTADELKNILDESVILFKLKTSAAENPGGVERYMTSYGYNVQFALCSEAVQEALRNAAAAYAFSFDDEIGKTLTGWSEYMTDAYNEARKREADYVITVENTEVTDNNIKIKGSVTPPVEYSFSAEAVSGNSVIGKEVFTTDSEGKYECELTVPSENETKEYRINISAVTPEPEITYYFMDDFSGDYVNIYVVDQETDRDKETGNPAPSLKVSKESGETRPRLLFASGEVQNLKKGVVVIQTDLMKPDNFTSSKILAVTDAIGNNDALNIYAKDGNIMFSYRNETGSTSQTELVQSYETNKWYTVKFEIDMGTRRTAAYVGDELKAGFTIGSSITDIGRIIDSEARESGVHYLDNTMCYQDTAYKIDASSESIKVSVPGTDRKNSALAAVNAASADTCISVLDEYNDVFALDLEYLNAAENKQAAVNAFAAKSYDGVRKVRQSFYGEIALELMKEADKEEKTKILLENQRWLGVSVDAETAGNSMFADLINKNVSELKNAEELAAMTETIVLTVKMKAATQMSIRGVLDENTQALEKLGLSAKYKNLSETQRKSVAVAAMSASSGSTLPDEIIKAMVSKVNEAIENMKNKTQGGGGSGGGSPSSSGGTVTSVGTGAATVPAVNARFSDVPQSHWAFDAVEYLAKQNILTGKGNNTFDPDAEVKREEFVKMLIGALKTEAAESGSVFEDVPAGSWYAPYVETAAKLGIVNGVSNTVFGTGLDISRQDAAVLLYRCKASLNSELEPVREYAEFDDAENIEQYAVQAVEYLYKCGVINGVGETRFAPKDSLTRAQVAKMLYEIIRR